LAAGPFGVVVFSDVDGNRDYDPATDATLGSVTHPGLGAHALDAWDVALDGVVRFRGERLFAKVDPELAWPELDESNNVGDAAGECAVAPPTAPFAPVVELEWPPAGTSVVAPGSIDSLSTPIVVQLTDDNGDGLWDERDVPDIAFVTTDFYELMEPQIYLRAIRGDTGAALFDVNGFLPHPTAPSAFSFSGLAAGDIDNDGRPELVTTTFGPAPNNVLIALEHTGARKWQSAVYHTHPDPTGLTNRDNPAIADLDADGFAEIVVGANVFDRFGHLLWRGAGGQAYQSSGNSGDRGGAISVVADVDLDGLLEVVTGNTLYRHDGEIVWQVPLGDGYPAVVNFDADPRPEIVVVSRGSVRLHDAEGGLLWGPVELPGSDPEAGGAPTVADFDGDGAPEIGVAGSDVYVVFESDGTIRWQASTQDYTSNLTGSTVFDLDGDGAFEVIYRDERRLRVYRGSDGVVLFEDVVSSNTWTEEPVVADVDRDGNAEIVVTSDRAPDVPMPGGERTAGLRIYGEGGDGWTWARSIWNQHAYTPDQVGDDASIPARPAWG
ncbi:MAG: VCBS repeat-containing protein, partial [Thermoanaerobaculia bacterium]|nr:VCBS repeat-containing protein [Thermoanaerobaculia bacterium]